MRASKRAVFATLVLGIAAATSPVLAYGATNDTIETSPYHQKHTSPHADSIGSAHAGTKHPLSKTAKARYQRFAGISCVPFARAASGIELKGNAVNWWDAAAGVYQRGAVPEAGAVLNFRATGGMRLGHVAVVRAVVGPREIVIDQANWAAKGRVSRGTRVIDVSALNDWSAVRVALGEGETFGAIYPTYGFIYDRPDSGVMVAAAPQVLHPMIGRAALAADEVAEAPPGVPQVINFPTDAPSHTLR